MHSMLDDDDSWPPIPRGQALDLLYVARVADGSPLELNGLITVSIVDASNPALAAAEVTKANAEHGYVRICVPEQAARQHMRSGRTNFFRLRFEWPEWVDQIPIITGKLWVPIDG